MTIVIVLYLVILFVMVLFLAHRSDKLRNRVEDLELDVRFLKKKFGIIRDGNFEVHAILAEGLDNTNARVTQIEQEKDTK